MREGAFEAGTFWIRVSGSNSPNGVGLSSGGLSAGSSGGRPSGLLGSPIEFAVQDAGKVAEWMGGFFIGVFLKQEKQELGAFHVAEEGLLEQGFADFHGAFADGFFGVLRRRLKTLPRRRFFLRGALFAMVFEVVGCGVFCVLGFSDWGVVAAVLDMGFYLISGLV